jgi:hypothetical protein
MPRYPVKYPENYAPNTVRNDIPNVASLMTPQQGSDYFKEQRKQEPKNDDLFEPYCTNHCTYSSDSLNSQEKWDTNNKSKDITRISSKP